MAQTSRPWSVTELHDLTHGLRLGVSIEVIADFIERDIDDVRQAAAEHGLLLRRSGMSEVASN
jgi:hypothetical protein